MTLLTLENASFSYEGKTVVSGLDFRVEQGDYLAVLGANGSGKSTLIKGLLKQKPTESGKITYENGLKNTDIGYLPQQTNVSRDFPASVFEVIMSGFVSDLKGKFFYSKEQKKKAKEIAEKLGISDILRKCCRDLSGGQKQRVLLARALCAADRLLLLDEPVAGLDPVVTAQMYELLRQLNADGVTIIMVSHDVNVAKLGANKILHIGGSQLYFGDSHEYLHTDLAKSYLGGCDH